MEECRKATDADIIKWQLKCLSEAASDLREGELGLIASFEHQFKRKGGLTERQMEVLEDIYKRRT